MSGSRRVDTAGFLHQRLMLAANQLLTSPTGHMRRDD